MADQVAKRWGIKTSLAEKIEGSFADYWIFISLFLRNRITIIEFIPNLKCDT